MSWDGVSASSISTSPESSGCHILKIQGYSQTKLLHGNGSRVSSCAFEAAGQPWHINYYPNGYGRGSEDHISLCVKFLGNLGTATITAKIRFSLVPYKGRPEPSTPYAKSFTAHYRGSGASYLDWGISCFVKKEDLEKKSSEYLVDDCLAIRCDIDVVKTFAVADPKVKEQDLERLALPCSCHDNLCKRLHPTITAPAVDASPSLSLQDDDDDNNKKSPKRRRGVKAAWFELFGCGKI